MKLTTLIARLGLAASKQAVQGCRGARAFIKWLGASSVSMSSDRLVQSGRIRADSRRCSARYWTARTRSCCQAAAPWCSQSALWPRSFGNGSARTLSPGVLQRCPSEAHGPTMASSANLILPKWRAMLRRHACDAAPLAACGGGRKDRESWAESRAARRATRSSREFSRATPGESRDSRRDSRATPARLQTRLRATS